MVKTKWWLRLAWVILWVGWVIHVANTIIKAWGQEGGMIELVFELAFAFGIFFLIACWSHFFEHLGRRLGTGEMRFDSKTGQPIKNEELK